MRTPASLPQAAHVLVRDTQPAACAGLELDPSNAQLKEGLESAQKAPEPRDNGLFGPQFMAKLAMDPTTRGYLQQPDFMQMLRLMQQNPSMMSSFMQDPRFSKALSVRWLAAHLPAALSRRAFLQQGTLLNQRAGSAEGLTNQPAALLQLSVVQLVHGLLRLHLLAGGLGHQYDDGRPVQGWPGRRQCQDERGSHQRRTECCRRRGEQIF